MIYNGKYWIEYNTGSFFWFYNDTGRKLKNLPVFYKEGGAKRIYRNERLFKIIRDTDRD